MKGGKNKKPAGYTIVEVMIVLAVSGMMFVIAALFIQGKQEKASFTAGINQMASQIQTTIEQVTDGQYSDITVPCNFTTTTTIGGSGSPVQQGNNPNCVFLGKLVHFLGGSSVQYEVVSVVGGRIDISGNPITSFPAADPRAVAPPDASGDSLTINQQ